MAFKIVQMECTACGDCEPLCPTNSIVPYKGVYKIEADTCNECEEDGDLPQCLDVCEVPDCILPV